VELGPGDESEALLSGDVDLLRAALDQLGNNAVARADSRVLWGTAAEPAWVSIWVDDDGPPPPREMRAALVEASHSRDASSIGLMVAERVARAHRGSVFIEEAPLGGARVGLRLPRAAEPEG
jgi:signal transduction histidine kinase